MLNLLEVITIFDETLRKPHPKMVACIHPDEGWFYRINSQPHLRPWVRLERQPHHTFLDHDSHLHCEILMLDDYIVERSLRHAGVIGTIDPALKPQIIKQTLQCRYISLADSQAICEILR